MITEKQVVSVTLYSIKQKAGGINDIWAYLLLLSSSCYKTLSYVQVFNFERESTSVFGDLVVYLLYFQITYVTDTILSRNLNITSQCKNCQDFFFQLFTFSAC